MTTTPSAGSGSTVPDSPDCAAWADVDSARSALASAREAAVAAEAAAQRALVDFLIAQHPDALEHGSRVDDRGRPVLWCEPEDFVKDLPRATRIEIAKFLDKSMPAAMHESAQALTAWCVMRKTAARLESGALPATRLWLVHRERERVPAGRLEAFDALVAAISAGLEWKAFRKVVADAASSLCSDESALADLHHETRRVSMRNNGDGSATLFATGPVQTVTASMGRMQGLARAIRRGDDKTVNAQVPEGSAWADDRTVDQLVFDLWINARHSLDVRVERVLPGGAAEGILGTAASDSDAVHVGPGAGTMVRVRMPLEADWLGRQAGVVVTVPVLTLLGLSDLPGRLDDSSPVPADLARLIAGSAGSFFRMLTDPLSGRGLEYPSELYPIPAAFRRAVAAVWAWCSTPGCSRRAETCEVDHVDPFNHDDPASGGLTELTNLQPLCKGCHQAKTNKQLGVRRRYLPPNLMGSGRYLSGTGEAARADSGTDPVDPAVQLAGRSASPVPVTEWVFPSRIAGCVVPPGDDLAVRHAAEVKELIDFQVRWLLSRELSRLDGTGEKVVDGHAGDPNEGPAHVAGGGMSLEAFTAAAHDFFDAEVGGGAVDDGAEPATGSSADLFGKMARAERRRRFALPGQTGAGVPQLPGMADLPAFRGVEGVEDLLTGAELRAIIREVTNWNTDGRCDDPYAEFTEEVVQARRAARESGAFALDSEYEITDADEIYDASENCGFSGGLRTADDQYPLAVGAEELREFLESGSADMTEFLAERDADDADASRAQDPDCDDDSTVESHRGFKQRHMDPARRSEPGPAPWANDADSPWPASDDPPPF